ncbi:probable tRNA (uracil-O(2)-)-methyltransferase isoform X1 [Centruroides sculpturatus]|uniref:probable tRNA (uracil-O(2)-)-methyltransferase isoform X1 n=1 Tax=Centruroides sculpturatus TaxID=218467 RepID=UPI000C6CBD18|nr:probable tRNA (uracil-O(2)-)-methyltransferase isoform X1 [Centruroides sculpturatus]
MMWESISPPSNEIEETGFWEALRVWIERPHIVNRRLMGVDICNTWTVEVDSKERSDECVSDSVYESLRQECLTPDLNVRVILQKRYVLSSCQVDIWEENGNNSGLFIQTRQLLPKQPSKFQIQQEIVILDRKERKVIFLSPCCLENNCSLTPEFDYRIILTDCNRIQLEKRSEHSEVSNNHSVQWLQTCVLRKICNWAKQRNKTKPIPSLSIIPISRYYSIYTRLKEKYWKKLIQIWPENTDPIKYIYEDIAIASYLLTLFELEKETKNISQKQTFVDLGCGNGLLVYLLISEGHSGIGIDIRKRSIWDLYEPKVPLIEKSITPSDKMLFPEYDWIIGNHSDELTPWIPVIAARSSYRMRIFLLPCCPYSFEGKYHRTHAGCSQYQSYLYFIQEVCEKMGFEVKEDKLRIPSTKRLCFVCLSRTYSSSKESEIDFQRTAYINKFLKQNANNSGKVKEVSKLCDKNLPTDEIQHNWISGFRPRNRNQEVCNCSTLDQNYIDDVVKQLASLLLNLQCCFITVSTNDNQIHWNRGGEMTIKDLASSLDPELLKKLKSQYGGLQTLLKNHRHIFSVIKDKVSMTVPTKKTSANYLSKSKKKKGKEPKFKTKLCWFHFNHPQGCPLLDEDCTFLHQEEISCPI